MSDLCRELKSFLNYGYVFWVCTMSVNTHSVREHFGPNEPSSLKPQHAHHSLFTTACLHPVFGQLISQAALQYTCVVNVVLNLIKEQENE